MNASYDADLKIINGDVVVWKTNHGEIARSCKLEDIIAVTKNSDNPDSFTIHHVEKKPQNILKLVKDDIKCQDQTQCLQWREEIHNNIPTDKRPKRLLIIVNPRGGRNKAKEMYFEKAAPLFELAGIETDIRITERKRHASDIIHEYDLSSVQGIVSIGGDGTFKECVDGLLLRTMKDAGRDPSDSQSNLVKPAVLIAPMPGGTVNVTSIIQYGTADFVTAALHIVLGHEGRSLDIGASFSGNSFLGYNALITAIGFSADYVWEAEKNRSFQFLGPFRYVIYFIKTLFFRKTYHLQITYKKHETISKNCSEETVNINAQDGKTALVLKRLEGCFSDVQIWNFQFYDNLEVECGGGHLYTAKDCSALNIIRFFNYTHVKDFDLSTLPYITRDKVDEVHIKINGGGWTLKDHYYVCLDGETTHLPCPEVLLKIHEGVLPCFGAPPQETTN